MRIFLFQRDTEDWSNVSLEDCTEFRLNLLQQCPPVLKQWSDQFSMTWQHYRQKLKELALSVRPMIPVLTNSEEVLDQQNDDVVIPIDDDDWLSPSIVSFVYSEMRDNDLLQWTQAVNSFKDDIVGRNICKWQAKVASTSDHCIRIGFLKKIERPEEVLIGHCMVFQRMYHTRRKYVPEVLSCWNYHVGSISLLRMVKDIQELESLIQPIGEIPEFAKQFETSIRKMDEIVLSLKK